jgi:EmrB/QacA subfamily drug resistance transporter
MSNENQHNSTRDESILEKGLNEAEFNHSLTNSLPDTKESHSLQNPIAPDTKPISKMKLVTSKFFITIGLVLGIFVGSMSETAVSTITEVIGSDLKSFGSLTWIAGGYLLTTVAFTPLFGKLSDIFGRKPIEFFSIALFSIGSLGCALANSMTLLIIFRAIAGIGGGGIMSMSFVMVSDVIPLENRSTYLSIISATFAIAQILGPIIGGALAEVNWRINFYIQLPLCLILLVLVVFVLDLPKSEGNILSKVKRVDFLGSLALVLTIVALILATNWGGKDYAWNSAPIIVLFVLMIIFFIAFIIIEWKVSPEPVLPSRVFVRNVVLSLTASFCAGAVQFVAIFYLPIYFQFVHGSTPSESGYRLIPFLAIISICCLSSGTLIKIFKTIRGVMWVGGAINIVGTCLVAFWRQNATLAEQVIFILINGIGLGLIFQLVIFTCTLSVAPEDVAIASGLFTFSMNIGGVVSLAIAGSIYNNVLTNQILERLPEYVPKDLLDPSVASALSEANKEVLRTCYHYAFQYAYICVIPFAIILFISVLGLTKLEIPGTKIQASGH